MSAITEKIARMELGILVYGEKQYSLLIRLLFLFGVYKVAYIKIKPPYSATLIYKVAFLNPLTLIYILFHSFFVLYLLLYCSVFYVKKGDFNRFKENIKCVFRNCYKRTEELVVSDSFWDYYNWVK